MICPSFWGVFRGGHAFFDPFGVKINVYGATIRPKFFVLSFLWFFDLFFLLLSSYSSLHVSFLILLFLYLNCLNSFCLFFKIICPQTPVLPIAASLILLVNNIKKKPRWKYHVPRPSHRNAASLILPALLMRKPREDSSLAKNPPKYTTAYIVQQSNCRWHCEPTFFLGWAFNKEKSFHFLPLQSLHLLLFISNPSLSKPSVSSPLSVWLLKHKE